MDVAEEDAPTLIVLDIMDRERLEPSNVLNEFLAPYHGWPLGIVRKYGHFYQ